MNTCIRQRQCWKLLFTLSLSVCLLVVQAAAPASRAQRRTRSAQRAGKQCGTIRFRVQRCQRYQRTGSARARSASRFEARFTFLPFFLASAVGLGPARECSESKTNDAGQRSTLPDAEQTRVTDSIRLPPAAISALSACVRMGGTRPVSTNRAVETHWLFSTEVLTRSGSSSRSRVTGGREGRDWRGLDCGAVCCAIGVCCCLYVQRSAR